MKITVNNLPLLKKSTGLTEEDLWDYYKSKSGVYLTDEDDSIRLVVLGDDEETRVVLCAYSGYLKGRTKGDNDAGYNVTLLEDVDITLTFNKRT